MAFEEEQQQQQKKHLQRLPLNKERKSALLTKCKIICN